MPNDRQIHLGSSWIDRLDKMTFDSVRINCNALQNPAVKTALIGVSPNKVVVSYSCPAEYEPTDFERVFFEVYSDDVLNFAELHPTLSIGCHANSVAECKNLEMVGVDYIQYDPPKDQPEAGMGKIPFLETLIPRKEEYGWVVMSLNTPIIVGGLNSPDEYEDIYQLADVKGVFLDEFHEDWMKWAGEETRNTDQ